jgi:hypothetical protein
MAEWRNPPTDHAITCQYPRFTGWMRPFPHSSSIARSSVRFATPPLSRKSRISARFAVWSGWFDKNATITVVAPVPFELSGRAFPMKLSSRISIGLSPPSSMGSR